MKYKYGCSRSSRKLLDTMSNNINTRAREEMSYIHSKECKLAVCEVKHGCHQGHPVGQDEVLLAFNLERQAVQQCTSRRFQFAHRKCSRQYVEKSIQSLILPQQCSCAIRHNSIFNMVQVGDKNCHSPNLHCLFSSLLIKPASHSSIVQFP